MSSWLDDIEWKGFGNTETIEDAELNLDVFDLQEWETDGNRIHIVYCLLTEDRCGEFSINTPFCNLQKKISEKNRNDIIFRSVVYGDGKICRIPFEMTDEENILYLSESVRSVSPLWLLMEADSILKDRLANYPGEKGILIIIRESDKGLETEEERLLKVIFSEYQVPYQLVLVENQKQEDWLEHLAEKQANSSFLYDEIDELVRKVRICQ